MSSVLVAVGAWVDVSALSGAGWIYCKDGVVNVYQGTAGSYDRAVSSGYARSTIPVKILPGTKFVRLDTVSDTPVCALVTDGNVTATVVAAMTAGISPAWGASIDRGANAGPGTFIMPPLATPDFEVQGSPDDATWFDTGANEDGAQRTDTAWGAFRYLRARAPTAISLQVVGFATASGGGGAPSGPAGGVLNGTYPNPDAGDVNAQVTGVFVVRTDAAFVDVSPVGTFQQGTAIIVRGENGSVGDPNGGSALLKGGISDASDPGAIGGAASAVGGVGQAVGGAAVLQGGNGLAGDGGSANVDAGTGTVQNGEVAIGSLNARRVAVGSPQFTLFSERYTMDPAPGQVLTAPSIITPYPLTRISAAAPITLTALPPISTLNLVEGTQVDIVNTGANAIDFTEASGLVLGAATRSLTQNGIISFVYLGGLFLEKFFRTG